MTAQRTVRIDDRTHRTLTEMKERTGRPLLDLLAEAVERFHDQFVIREMNAGYARLRADPDAWREELAERALWDATLMDGLEPE